MAHIGIDCRFAATASGLGRYTRQLVPKLIEHAPRNTSFTLFVQRNDEPWLQALRDRSTIVEVKAKHYSLGEQIELPRLIRAAQLGLFFAPHFNVPFFCPVPFVATIHDLILHRYPNEASFLKQAAYRILSFRCVRRAQKLIAVSAFTAKEIRHFYGKRVAAKVQRVTEGIDPLFHARSSEEQQHARQKFSLTKPFFLYVGNAKEHKNVPLLIDAYQRSSRTDADLVLVTGGKEAAAFPSSPGVRLISSISDAELAALYSGALALVTASLYEGFCLPILEARACGCPIIATNKTAIPEIAGNSAMLLEPDVDAFADALKRATSPHQEPQDDLPSWDSCAKEAWKVLRGTLE